MVLVQKLPFFQVSFLGNIGQENVFYDILERKNTFLRYKKMKSKKSKNCHFSKGVNPWFCLLYTSDAADDLLCVDLGGRRIIKKKNLEKWQFLDQNHRLTRLEKCQLFDFLNFLFL